MTLTASAEGDPAMGHDPEDWRAYDDGDVVLTPLGGRALELLIPYFTDCDGSTMVTIQCGGTPGRWVGEDNPVEFCTLQAGRPPSVTAQQFRDVVESAARMWTATEAAVGVRYEGDCVSGGRWEDQNGVNEVAFDDFRDVVRGSAAAVAHGSWVNQPGFGLPTSREYVEFDIVVDHLIDVPDACFQSVVAHEMGHALGFGHSDTTADLMYHSFNPNDLATCPGDASPAEVRRIQELYGVNRAPVFPAAVERAAVPGAIATLSVAASDPEGDALTYEWQQVAGTPVRLDPTGGTLRFTAPQTPGARLEFRVTALDRYLHRAAALVAVTVGGQGGALPALTPSLAEIDAGAAGAMLRWDAVAGASAYEFCTGLPGGTLADCESLAQPSAPVTWDTVLGPSGSPDERRVLTSGARETSMAACTASGCTPPGAGPVAAGLQWAAWEMDFDVFAMAYDVPGTGIRFTIGGVANISGETRRFTLYSGTPSDPLAERIHACGRVEPGEVCIGLLTPRDDGHRSQVTIVSERDGTPTTEHHLAVR